MNLPELVPHLGLRSAAALVLLTALGFLGNVLNVEVFLAFHYLFGNLPALLVALEFGPVWGAASALVAASYTVPLFGHPYALLWLVGEVAFVGILARRHPSRSVVVWDAAYWLVLGGPLIGLVFTQGMGTSGYLAHVVALKHGVNGLANASLASLLASQGWLWRLLLGRRDRPGLSMQQATFQLLVVMVVVPALAFTVGHGRRTSAQIEQEAGRDAAARAQLLADRLASRLADRRNTRAFIDRLARDSGSAAAAVAAQAVMAGTRDISEISLVDAVGRETSLHSRSSAAGRATGARILIDGETPDLLPAGRPIEPRAGAVVTLDPAGLASFLRSTLATDGQSATVLTRDLLAAATTRTDLAIMSRHDPWAGAEARSVGPGVFRRTPRRAGPLPEVERWRRSSLVAAAAVPGTPGWTVVVDEPLAPYQGAINRELTRMLWLVLALLYASIGLSSFFADRLARPLAALATATTGLPDRLQRREEPSWPATWITEIARLVANVQGMARELRARFDEVETARSTLERRVEERTVELRQEVEAHRRAREELRESEERLRLALSSANQGLWDLHVPSGRAVVSAEYASMLDYDPATFVETHASWLARLHPDDAPRVAETFRAYVEGNLPAYRVEFRQRTASGQWKWILSSGKAVAHDAEGRPVRMLGTHTDLTSRVEAEQALQESEERFRRLAENAPDLIYRYRLRPAAAFEYVSPAATAITGYTPEEHYADPELIWKIAHPDDRHLLKKVREGEGQVPLTLRWIRKDGRETWTELRNVPVRDEQGVLVAVEGIARDVTARVRAEEEVRRLNADLEHRVEDRTAQLEAANQELEAFAYSVSHDLRAPLRHVDGYNQALLEDFGDSLTGEARQYCERMRAASQTMGQLIDDLLSLSRVSRSELNREAVDLSTLAREVFDPLRESDPARRVEVEIQPGVAAWGDARLLRVVLENLLGNAWKYTARTPEAHIAFGTAEANGDHAFFVRDDGAGFDMNYVGKLFHPFQRLHAREEFEGSGIGLATVRRIVQRHGGKVWAEGAVDKGATFYFTLGEAKGSAGVQFGHQGAVHA